MKKLPLDKVLSYGIKENKTLERRCGMERFKEKNKKNARRFGMNKKELLSLALAGAGILGLAAGNVIAGMSVVTQKVALEIIPDSSDEKTAALQSNPIVVDGILAGNGSKITLQLNNGFFPQSAGVGLCRNTELLAIGQVSSSSDNSTVILDVNQNKDIGSSDVLRVVSNMTSKNFNCTENKTDGVPVRIKGGLNAGDTVDLTIGSISGTLFKVQQQFTAKIVKKATDYLDPNYEYKKLRYDKVVSNATYKISNATLQIPVNNGSFEISLSGDSFAGVANATVHNATDQIIATLNATYNWTKSATLGSFSFDNDSAIKITVTGNDALTPRTFKVSLRTVRGGDIVREIYLLKDEVSHEWLMPGVTYYIPFVVARPGDETYIVLQASKGTKSSYTVTISALDDNGDFKSLNAMPMNPGDRLVIKASDIKAQVPSLTKERFAVMINVDGDESQIFAYANICNANGICKRVPVKAKSGMIVE
jgi:hypothetical protein